MFQLGLMVFVCDWIGFSDDLTNRNDDLMGLRAGLTNRHDDLIDGSFMGFIAVLNQR